jgi:SAM-dependent methyltransferase
MHPDALAFVRLVRDGLPELFSGTRVLEVGSLDINGSIRELFDAADYTGLDLGEGPGVDIVCPGQAYDEPDGSFDVVASSECLEHNPFWRETILNMTRLLRPGGLFVMTCAGPGRDEHGTSRAGSGASPLTIALGQEYYRNLHRRDLSKVGGFYGSFAVHADWLNWAAHDFYLVGVRAGSSVPDAWPRTVASIDSWVRDRSSGAQPWLHAGLLTVGGARSVDAWWNLRRRSSAR